MSVQYRPALTRLAARQLVQLRDQPDEIVAIRRPEAAPEVYVKFHLPSGHWTAFPGKLRGHGLYAAARILGLTLADLTDAFHASPLRR